MRFGVLGPLEVWTAGGERVTIPGLKVRALLADLLVHAGRPVSVDRLVDDLWGQDVPGNPSAAVQVRVSQLRKALEDAEPGARDLVVSRSPGYLLQVEPDAVDAGRFAALVARAEAAGDTRTAAALLADALSLWRGPAFADFADEEFTQATVVRLEEQRLSALEQHVEARLELGEHGALVGELGDLVAGHPLRERLRAVHLKALYRSGRQSEALASYGELRERLADELGLDPGPELAALHQAILEQDPALNPARERPRTNLPAQLSDLIGRDAAVTEVGALLGERRLVTLTGPGGVGKTRLAVEAAGRLVEAYPDGVWLVELAPVDSPLEAVEEALDIRQDTDLAEALRARKLLLVLDNCEHLVEPVAELVGRLLRAAPGLRVLATSREPLGLPGEAVWGVPPLAVPDGAEPRAVADSGAVRLFTARASGFTLDEGNVDAVARLVRRLDGIPLAIELAATKVRALGVHKLAERLEDRFRLLAMGHRGTTLTTMIDWSWNLLTEPERIVLRRLSVHAGGCTLEAAEEVCSGGDVDPDDVLDLLVRLVDRSLVATVDTPLGIRYRLLESVAEYSRERLAQAGEQEELAVRHAGYYTALAERADPLLRGGEQREWLDRLDAEAANLRAARGSARLANALVWYWFLRGRLVEARETLDRFPDDPRAAAWRTGFALMLGEQADRAAVLDGHDDPRALLFAAQAMPDLASVQELVSRALPTLIERGDTWGEAWALNMRAMDAFTRRDAAALERDATRGRQLFRTLGDRWGQLKHIGWLGGLAEMQGDHATADRLFTEGLRMAEELRLWPESVRFLAWRGWIAMESGDYDRAIELCGRGMDRAVEQGFREGLVFTGMGLGFSARRAGRFELAEEHLTRLLDGVPRDPDVEPALHLPDTLIELGFMKEAQGRADAARELHLEALALAERIGDPRTGAFAVAGLAGALAATGSPAVAARLLGVVTEAMASLGTPAGPSSQVELDRITAGAREALGDAAFEAEFERGRRVKLADVRTVLD
ncbi:BTAD domain-containing putative transcriptional regulator [Nonomuraea sediminis]|uniref:BTAD domain-containing putative transcriptional regulator n=1 Tax=Nonomuraea sediminis TaxID=2835864 RepID=UPI001BDCD373|nr:BTAD domain-containing putative transcriptional regulator [Nonomuraea sediminis]